MFQPGLPGRLGILLRENTVTFFKLFVILVFFSVEAVGQDLLVIPRRMVFDGVKRKSQELNLANTGKDTARYTITLIEVKMNENGTFEEIKTPDSAGNYASKYLSIFPRYVTLGPNESQTVKVRLTHINQLADGEYRSHIYVKSQVKRKRPDKRLKKMVSNLSVRLIPVFGISIPVVIKVGEPTTRITLSGLSFNIEKGIPILSLVMNRSGNMSAYGNLLVEYTSKNGNTQLVGNVKGLSVYAPNPLRKVKVALNNDKGMKYTEGKLRVMYTTQVEDRLVKVAEAELEIK